MKEKIRWLVLPACVLPLFWLGPFFVGFSQPEYSSVAQHLSELSVVELSQLNHNINYTGGLLVNLATLCFALGLLFADWKLTYSTTAGLLYAIGMLSNFVFPMGTPLHGLYGLPIFSVVLPVFFLIEHDDGKSNAFRSYTLFTTLVALIYLWLMMSGLDPTEYRGLTQRAAIIVLNTWIAWAAYRSFKSLGDTNKKGPQRSEPLLSV